MGVVEHCWAAFHFEEKSVCGGFIWSKRECLFEFKRTVPFGKVFYLVTNFYGTFSFQRNCICLSIFFGGKQRD